MLISILINFYFGLRIGKQEDKRRYWLLALGVSLNLALLISYKYANFLVDNLNYVISIIGWQAIDFAPIHLPLGISFFTFQAISYLVDVYRKQVDAQSKLLNLGLYISLFPQLIAGPIVRYAHIAKQINERSHSSALFASGIRRFLIGLSKKVLIANPLGLIADAAFLMSGDGNTSQIAWIGITAYALQIYFDFSGYSDMAIGLGRMFGFTFLENFNFPYISKSLREFWQRWHISLSTWFRDYLYIPLGGNRVTPWRVYLNLSIVFFLTGIWHGASWNFIVWGMFHGAFLTIEHMGFRRVLERVWFPVRHAYVIVVLLVSWVFFRAEDLPSAFIYLGEMLNILNWQTSTYQYQQLFDHESLYVLVLATILATPIVKYTAELLDRLAVSNAVTSRLIQVSQNIGVLMLFYVCAIKLSGATYNPFIYFRF